jgi:hypothetical protein
MNIGRFLGKNIAKTGIKIEEIGISDKRQFQPPI